MITFSGILPVFVDSQVPQNPSKKVNKPLLWTLRPVRPSGQIDWFPIVLLKSLSHDFDFPHISMILTSQYKIASCCNQPKFLFSSCWFLILKFSNFTPNQEKGCWLVTGYYVNPGTWNKKCKLKTRERRLTSALKLIPNCLKLVKIPLNSILRIYVNFYLWGW